MSTYKSIPDMMRATGASEEDIVYVRNGGTRLAMDTLKKMYEESREKLKSVEGKLRFTKCKLKKADHKLHMIKKIAAAHPIDTAILQIIDGVIE